MCTVRAWTELLEERWGSRQHYLRWENPTTWQILDEVGIAYDTTLGFADHIGFRCGTCREFPVFNLKTRQALRLRERPLVVMDVTMLTSKYMGLQPEEALEQIRWLADKCRLYGGNFGLLWHNTILVEEFQRKLYLSCLETLL